MNELQASKLQKATFFMDALSGEYEGYTAGEKWNGFECPYFDFSVAKQVVKDAPCTWSYHDDETGNYFLTLTEDGESDRFDAVFTEDGKELYAIGAWGWCWGRLPF